MAWSLSQCHPLPWKQPPPRHSPLASTCHSPCDLTPSPAGRFAPRGQARGPSRLPPGPQSQERAGHAGNTSGMTGRTRRWPPATILVCSHLLPAFRRFLLFIREPGVSVPHAVSLCRRSVLTCPARVTVFVDVASPSRALWQRRRRRAAAPGGGWPWQVRWAAGAAGLAPGSERTNGLVCRGGQGPLCRRLSCMTVLNARV